MNNAVLVEILKHRSNVQNKLKSLGNDLIVRGRRHDNSYSDPTEMAIYTKVLGATDATTKHRYQAMLDNIHAKHNDYHPGFHDYDVSKMNMIQLLEYIAELIVRLDEARSNYKELAPTLEEYQEYVLTSFEGPLSEDLAGIISETVEYIVDRNKSILKNLPKDTVPDGFVIGGEESNGEK